MKITVLIADDEPVARRGLREMLAATDWVACVGEAASGPETVERIEALRPDLLLLDIQMPGFSGTDVLKRITHQPAVIFTTAFGQHAVTAFELGALDYLLKPFGSERLAAALERVRAAFGEPQSASPFDRLREALRKGPMSRLFVRRGGSIVPVAVEDVFRFEAQGDYVVAHVGPAQHVLHIALHQLEARIDPERFIRIHRAHIVNLDFVKAFRREGKGQLAAVMADGARLPVSRSRAKELRDLGA